MCENYRRREEGKERERVGGRDGGLTPLGGHSEGHIGLLLLHGEDGGSRREGGSKGGREGGFTHTHTLREGGREGGRTYPIAGLCGNSERHVGFLLLHRKDRGESLCC